MPMNRLSILFDRKLRSSKSASNLVQATTTADRSSLPSQPWSSRSKEQLNVTVDYKFDRLPPPPRHPPPPPPPHTARPVSPRRAGSTPLMHPPDELFLRVVRRRSANARLEEQRIQSEYHYIYQNQDVPTSVAIACALPPQYFDLPPKYESPQKMKPIPSLSARGTIKKTRGSELFLDDPLHVQIDQAIADFRGFSLTEATPVHSAAPGADDPLVSPINEVDAMYLERRRQRSRQAKQFEHSHRNTT